MNIDLDKELEEYSKMKLMRSSSMQLTPNPRPNPIHSIRLADYEQQIAKQKGYITHLELQLAMKQADCNYLVDTISILEEALEQALEMLAFREQG